MRADRIVLGLFVVIAGSVWLLVNLGLLPVISVRELWRYWPLLLILWGILLLFGKGSSGGSGCFIAILVVVLISVGMFSFIPTSRVTGKTIQTDIHNMDGADSIRMNLTQHAGELRLTSHKDHEQLVKLELQTSEKPSVSHTTTGNITNISITDQNKNITVGKRASRWQLSLPEGFPADITLQTGALDAELDMSQLLVQSLEIQAGATDLTMKLSQTNGRIHVKSGASNITIYIPENVGIRLQAKGALLTVNSENGRVVSIGERRYESREIESKHAVVDIEITAAAGSVNLRRY